MTQYSIVTDVNRCVGCLACSTACKAVNGVPIGSFWCKTLRIGPNAPIDGVNKADGSDYLYFLTVQCQHCENPACVQVCPTEASHKL
ncbi:4Fe-4S dicluster domain-containing protein, partial [Parvibacter caecicola]